MGVLENLIIKLKEKKPQDWESIVYGYETKINLGSGKKYIIKVMSFQGGKDYEYNEMHYNIDVLLDDRKEINSFNDKIIEELYNHIKKIQDGFVRSKNLEFEKKLVNLD